MSGILVRVVFASAFVGFGVGAYFDYSQYGKAMKFSWDDRYPRWGPDHDPNFEWKDDLMAGYFSDEADP